MNVLVKIFRMQLGCYKVVTIATNAEVYNYVIFVHLKANVVGCFSIVRRTYASLVAMVGCHGDMVTMTTVSDNLSLYSSKGITSTFCTFLSWNQNFSVKLLKFYEGLVP